MFNEMCPPNSSRHVVKKGDTLWLLSQTYGVSVESIMNLNPGINPQNLQIGSTLCIPAAAASAASPASRHTCPDHTYSYIVHSGDTLWKLSQTYGISVQSILDLNPGVDPQNLQIGSTLCLPMMQTAQAPMTQPAPSAKKAPQMPTMPISQAPMTQAAPPAKKMPQMPTMPVSCPKGSFSYTIQPGDTLWKLSQAYGISVQSILDLNPGVDPQNLQIGSTLCIPVMPTAQAPMPQQAPYAKKTPQMPVMPAPMPSAVQPVKKAPQVPAMPPAPVPMTPVAPPVKQAPAPAMPIPLILAVQPAKKAPVPTAPISRNFKYMVRRCDCICKIARKFFVSVESILRENPGLNPKCLRPGTCIYVPINCCGENTWRYVVKPCDTLHTIANKCNVCPEELIAANPNIDFKCLVPCQIICVPK